MVMGRCRVFLISLLLIGCQVGAQEDGVNDTGSMGGMQHGQMGSQSEESEEEEMAMGPLPSCFETDMAYIGYPMNNPESGGRFLEKCPNPQHCQIMCQEDSRCQWFNWSNSTCPVSGKLTTKCWMKTGKGNAKAMPGGITGPKYCKPHIHRSCIEQGRMYIGDGLNVWKRRKNNFGRQKTEARCQDLCKRTNGCQWFNWNNKSQCWLKRSHGQRVKSNVRLEPGVSTGPGECPQIPAGKNCDEGWQYFEGKCYLVNLKTDNETLAFENVTQLCTDHNAILVSLQSEKEYNFITDILDRNYFQQEGVDFWVGAKRPSDDGGYTWQEDATEVQVFKWAEGEPSPGNRCLQLVKDDFATWVYETEGCEEEDDDGSYICEKSANNVTIEEVTDVTESVLQEMSTMEEEILPTTIIPDTNIFTEATEQTTGIPLSEDTTPSVLEEGSGTQSDDALITPCTTPDISNGNMDCTDEFECLLTCNDGYSAYPHSKYRCKDGEWEKAAHSEPLPLELIKCSPSKLVIGGCSVSTNNTMIQISDSTETCSIAPLPGVETCNYGYTLDFVDGELLACGGYPDPRRCLKFNYKSKTWIGATELEEDRMDSVSVVMGSTIYLIGGTGSNKIETVSFNSAKDSFESTLDQNMFTYDVAGDCSVAISSDTILTLTLDNFFSYNVTSGLGDDLPIPSPMNIKDSKVPCTTYTRMDSGNMRRKLMVANGVGDAVDKPSGDKLGFVYDVEWKTWVNTLDALTSYTGGQLVTIEGGELILINPKAEHDEGRAFRYTHLNPAWEEYVGMMTLEQSTINGPATTVPADLFTCERFGTASEAVHECYSCGFQDDGTQTPCDLTTNLGKQIDCSDVYPTPKGALYCGVMQMSASGYDGYNKGCLDYGLLTPDDKPAWGPADEHCADATMPGGVKTHACKCQTDLCNKDFTTAGGF